METWSTPQSPRNNNRSMQDDKKRSPLGSDDDWEVLNQNDSKHNDHSPTNQREQQQSSLKVEPLQQDSEFFKPTQEQQFLSTNSNLQNQRENDFKMIENQTKTNKASIWPIFPIEEIQYLPQQQNQVRDQARLLDLMPYQGDMMPAQQIIPQFEGPRYYQFQQPAQVNPRFEALRSQQIQQPAQQVDPLFEALRSQQIQQPAQQVNPLFETHLSQLLKLRAQQVDPLYEALRSQHMQQRAQQVNPRFEALRSQQIQQPAQQVDPLFEALRSQQIQQPAQQVNPLFETHLSQLLKLRAQQVDPLYEALRSQHMQQRAQQVNPRFEALRSQQIQQPAQQVNPRFEALRSQQIQQRAQQVNPRFEALRSQQIQQPAQQVNPRFEALRSQQIQQPAQQVIPQVEALCPHQFQQPAQQVNPQFEASRSSQQIQQPAQQINYQVEALRPRFQQAAQQVTHELEAPRPRQKMLVLLANGEQRLLNVPFIEERNNVQEVLVQNGIHIKNLEWAIYSNVDIVVTELKLQEDTISSAKPKPHVKLSKLPSGLGDVPLEWVKAAIRYASETHALKQSDGVLSSDSEPSKKMMQQNMPQVAPLNMIQPGATITAQNKEKVQQLLQSLKNNPGPEQQLQLLQLLKANPKLMAAFIEQRQQNANNQQNQQKVVVQTPWQQQMPGVTRPDIIGASKPRIATPDIALKESDYYLSDCGSESGIPLKQNELSQDNETAEKADDSEIDFDDLSKKFEELKKRH